MNDIKDLEIKEIKKEIDIKEIEKDLEKLFVSVKNLEYKNNWVTVYTQYEGISSILFNAIEELFFKKYNLIFISRYYKNGVVLEFRLKRNGD